ncbi:Ankyrin Repeat Protein [Seminavis robusta]|uniref:Ankyrin Repeat Protein n=1 Tax=Seminavis robusta TaxID=568900 RepID=A0A9N8DUT2_9STRA|nr:Ankyrin Repeat Protein [Seminavis robusta]|eukprot:Sro388_g132260.1 Ankyrin Repeat Protein (299) ;mRNA; f:14283-15179
MNHTTSLPIIEDEATARRKLEEAHFDPDDAVSAANPPFEPKGISSWTLITPMTHFCYYGDLPMCRYLLSRGGLTTRSGREFWFPMYAAAFRGNLDVCKWLFENGAQEEVRTANSDGHSPLSVCWGTRNKERIAMRNWLLMNGAIQDEDGNIHETTLRSLRPRYKKAKRRGSTTCKEGKWVYDHPHVLSWSQDVLKSRSNFQLFLLGTYDKNRSASALTAQTELSPVQRIGGCQGVLKCIAEFVGVVCSSNDLKIHRRLVELLPLIMDKNNYPSRDCFLASDSESDSDESDESDDDESN